MNINYKSYSDAQLAELLILRDIRAYEVIYDRYWVLLFSFARKMLQDDEQAKDVIQEVFITLYEKMDSMYNESIKAFLFASVRNGVLKNIRHQKVRFNYIAAFKDLYNSGEWVTDDHIRTRELQQLIENEINNLPPKMRKIFELSRKHYLSHKEIADATGISEGTVKKQLYYAISKLRSKLSCLVWLQIMSAIFWLNK